MTESSRSARCGGSNSLELDISLSQTGGTVPDCRANAEDFRRGGGSGRGLQAPQKGSLARTLGAGASRTESAWLLGWVRVGGEGDSRPAGERQGRDHDGRPAGLSFWFAGAGAEGVQFPSVTTLVDADLTTIGLTRQRSASIRDLAVAVAQGAVVFDGRLDADGFEKSITAIRGIGPWTAQYIAMRLGEPDAFPSSDLYLRHIGARSEAWRPWRAYAAMHLWKASRRRTMNYCYVDSPVGRLLVAGDENSRPAHRVSAGRYSRDVLRQVGTNRSSGPIQEAVRQLREYFSGARTEFDLPLAPEGTTVPAHRLGSAAGDPVRADDLVRRTGEARRQSQSVAGGRCGQRLQSLADRDSLPPRDRRERQADRVRRGTAHQATAAFAGGEDQQERLRAGRTATGRLLKSRQSELKSENFRTTKSTKATKSFWSGRRRPS